MTQIELFTSSNDLPEGFLYHPEFISTEEERTLVAAIERLEFAEINMHGVVAKRRVAHFGRNYEYQTATIGPAAAIPEFLLPLRERVGEFAEQEAEDFAEVLVSHYPPTAGIGWHRDAPAFGIIVGVSLLGKCTMQLRPWPVKQSVAKRGKPLAHILEPRSAYLLNGPSRTRWQHCIPRAKTRRLSISFRTLRFSVALPAQRRVDDLPA